MFYISFSPSFFSLDLRELVKVRIAEQQPGAPLCCAPVYPELFWATEAVATTAFELPVGLCIIATQSVFVK